jgi:23S rRNA (pseudouridine1915-N3)-methyltransferase
MKIAFWQIGKTKENYLKTGEEQYEKRLKHYLSFESKVFPDIKNAGKLKPIDLKKAEAKMILAQIQASDLLIILDEKGKEFNSVEFANFNEKLFHSGSKRIIYLVGGAFGFDESIYERANKKIALSKMTFTHQMVRLFFLEQLYRAMTILKNEQYHNT